MSASVTLNRVLTARETVAFGLQHGSSDGIDHSLALPAKTLNASSTPVASQVVSKRLTLSAGAVSLDLAAVARGSQLADLDLSGLKVQAIQIACPAANTAPVVAGPHMTNGYALFGASNDVSIPAGGDLTYYAPEGTPDVGASAKVIEFTSTDVDAVVDVLVVAG